MFAHGVFSWLPLSLCARCVSNPLRLLLLDPLWQLLRPLAMGTVRVCDWYVHVHVQQPFPSFSCARSVKDVTYVHSTRPCATLIPSCPVRWGRQQCTTMTRRNKRNTFIRDLETLPKDLIIENERGATILGYPLFSPRLLIPHIDPPQFQMIIPETGTLQCISNDIISSFHQLYPFGYDEEQEQAQKKWFVMMDFKNRYDMDDQGWCYSWTFNNERWKSKNGIVRRRVWVRLSTTDTSID
ncbi:hypothetical protein NCAS_0E01720 [Naumovozyma castellii]|uniref:Peroxin/Ferlin domain-containing protein n=1 Tax=Naumovozyma castellii TaxID=27288 RepID=G0VFH6_NAUCA|nr:hypothetical protein NCAS_0E01720 [Naumovozyma castellii CBS 4309]CCC70242.1 hypothetical protein NCAS_0E01720 [Naumovozyma castellii CBS 4309]